MPSSPPPPSSSRVGSPPSTRRAQPIVYFIGLTAALAGLLFGLDVGVISGAEEFIQKNFKLSDAAIELVVSALLWGAACGALLSGFLSSRFGRRRTILFSAVNFIIGALLCAFAPNEQVLVGARFLLGIAVGVASFTGAALSVRSRPAVGAWFADFDVSTDDRDWHSARLS